MREDRFAQRVLGHENRDGSFVSNCQGAARDGLASLVQVEVVKREHADVSLVAPPPVLLASASCANAFAAPATKWNVPRGTMVFRLGLSGLMGPWEKFCRGSLYFGNLGGSALDYAIISWHGAARVVTK